jgi:hypothetical protein
VLILRLLWLCNRKANQHTCHGTTFFRYLEVSVGFLGM